MRHFFSTLLARKIFLPAAVALLALAGMGQARAGTCTILPGNQQLQLGQVNVPPSAAIGDTLASMTILFTVSCGAAAGGAASPGYRVGFMTDSTWKTTSMPDVWGSNSTAGIGVRLTSTTVSSLTGTTVMVVSNASTALNCRAQSTAATNAVCRLSPDQVGPGLIGFTVSIKIELIKTAASISTQALTGYVVGPFTVDINGGTMSSTSGHQFASGGGATFPASTCTLAAPGPVIVTLPPLNVSQLSSPGMTGGDKDFSLGFTCDGASKNVRITMTDVLTTGTADDKLTLSPNTASATGVKLQVLYNGTPITFNPNSQAPGMAVGSSTGGGAPFSIPLTVRYVSTGTVTPGTVNASATFTLSYQ
jgi:type 1 fimbria pilin